MVNILALVEKVNKTTGVSFPVRQVFPVNETILQAFNKAHIKVVKIMGSHITVIFQDVEDVNRFAAAYFPTLFNQQLTVAVNKDRKIRRTLSERLKGFHPTPHQVIAEQAIQGVSERLSVCGVDLPSKVWEN